MTGTDRPHGVVELGDEAAAGVAERLYPGVEDVNPGLLVSQPPRQRHHGLTRHRGHFSNFIEITSSEN